MRCSNERTRSCSQAGFTLVELAIVMIIIGLLIGGVLKGQELINNARITATVSQVKSIDAATTTFRDMYGVLPGDITNPGVRLPNCAGTDPCQQGGDGDTRVQEGVTAPEDAVTANGENQAFWSHLAAADLLTGINPAAGAAWGGLYPAAEIAGGFHMGFDNTGTLGANAASRAGHYLLINVTPGQAADGTSLTATQASRIDQKLDDGVSNTGGVFEDDGADCGDAAGVYQEADQTLTCDLFIRFQN